MNPRATAVVVRVGLILLSSVAGFVLFQGPVRGLEAELSNWLLTLLPGASRSIVTGRSIVVQPFNGPAFRAIITPSCSCLASVLAIGFLASFSMPVTVRTLRATLCGVLVVAAGNILRIAGSVGVGLFAGRSSLILFHDWVGGLMTFVFTLGGYVLLLYLLLPGDRAATADEREVISA